MRLPHVALGLVLVLLSCKTTKQQSQTQSSAAPAQGLPAPGTRIPVAACGSEPCAIVGARSFAVSGNQLFVLHDGKGLLQLAPDGREATVVAALTGKSLVADDDAAYVASSGVLGRARSADLRRVERASGATRTIAEQIDTPWQLTADATYVYWKSKTLTTDTVWRVAKKGGKPEAVVEQSGLSCFALLQGAVLYSVNGSDRLWRVTPGGAPQPLARVGRVSALAFGPSEIYLGRPTIWSEILRLKTGEREPELVAKLDCTLSELVSHDRELLATCRTEGRVIAVPTPAGKPVGVLKSVEHIEQLTVVGEWLFWLRDGRLFRMKR